MKIIFTLILLLTSQLCPADDNLAKLTAKDVIAKLNKEDVIKVVFWLKPRLETHDTISKFNPRYDPKWMVTIANHSIEDIVIDEWWFTCTNWLTMIETKSGEKVARYSSFPPKEIRPIKIKKNGSIEIELNLNEYVSLASSFYDDRAEISKPGEYKVTHDIFPSAELRFSITKDGVISIVMPPIYEHNK